MVEYGYFWFWLLLFLFLLQSAVLIFRRWRSPSLARLALGNAVVLFFLLFALFLGGEAYFYFWRDTTDAFLAPLSSRRWIERHVRINALGFRGPPLPARNPGRELPRLRVCALGDSFTFGHGIARVEDRWTEVLEEKLRGTGRDARVFNLAQLGWNTSDELHALRKLQPRLACNVVVLGYVLNDHGDLLDSSAELRRMAARASNPPAAMRAFVKRSMLLDFFWVRYLALTSPHAGRHDERLRAGYDDPGIWKNHRGQLAELREYCRGHGIRLVAVTFPLLHRPWPEYRLEEVHHKLDSFWFSQSVEHVDLLMDLRGLPVAELTVNRFDSHPNERVQRIAAEQLFEQIVGN